MWKIIKFEEVFIEEIGTTRSVHDLVKLHEVVSRKFKLLVSVALQEDVQDNSDEKICEDVEYMKDDEMVNDAYNDERVIDVYNDDYDVRDFMMEEVGSSYNSPDVNNHDKVKTSVEGEVDEEPGGNVSTRSRRSSFRRSKA